jgi:hypothetical protein
MGSRSRSATWGLTNEEELADEERDDLWVHPCVGCRCVRAAPGWFRWRLVCTDDGLWATVELIGGSELSPLDLRMALLRRHRWFAQMVGGWSEGGWRLMWVWPWLVRGEENGAVSGAKIADQRGGSTSRERLWCFELMSWKIQLSP